MKLCLEKKEIVSYGFTNHKGKRVVVQSMRSLKITQTMSPEEFRRINKNRLEVIKQLYALRR